MDSSELFTESTDELDSEASNLSSTSQLKHATGIVNSEPVRIDECYDTSNPSRGIALIINQVNFTNMMVRDGSNKDRNDISTVLKRIGFDVRVYDDPKRKQLLSMLDKVADEDHSQNDCLVIVVMTHGEENNFLCASDKSYEVNRLWAPFLGDACPSLIGKPKLFFVQACRGKQMDQGVRLVRMSIDSHQVQSSPESMRYVIPTMADLLVMYSTYDGHYSWRNTTKGSWFIQSLCTELESSAYGKELLHILTAVSRR
uniref:Caspase family p20 domain-containing protein n=1 Tax=Anopheles christyi TaxID=43041 RepID=A0A182KA67_9DIPT